MPTLETLEANPLPSGDVDATKLVQERKGIESSSVQLAVKPVAITSEKPGKDDIKSDPFVLGEGLPILPAKLTAKILRGEFVEMHELLQDNIALKKKVAEDPNCTSHAKPSKKRELTEDVQGLLSWVECFNLFSSVLTTKYPKLDKALTAYQSTIVHEARRFGFQGWLQYDQLFRQHGAKDSETAAWGSLNSALYRRHANMRKLHEF